MPENRSTSSSIGATHGVGTAHTIHAGDTVDGGSYVDVDGNLLWHFRGGDPAGAPTVLLHGAFASAATWGAQIAGLSDVGLRLHVPELTGHGHSPDVDADWSMEAMTAQTIAYLESVVGRPAHLVGWSDGAVRALLVARARPDLVSRVVLMCHYMNSDGRAAAGFFDRLAARDSALVEFLREGYKAESPDSPEHFNEIYRKSETLLRDGPEYPLAEFATVAAPTLVLAADRGVVRLEHSLALARTLPNGRFAVLPGTHILPIEAPDLVNPLVSSFLAAEPPREWSP
ncbi:MULTISPECIES: alpha/beta fold hydrolase [unclassified Gordonia (in: high G+C Gram-positive bacteria)]